jgi:GntR family transcriptional regulator of arabinose operon
MSTGFLDFSGLDLSGNGPPKYERLKSYLTCAILAGHLQPGDALPAEKELAVDLKIATNTVRQALTGLANDGLLKRIHGKGTFVNDPVSRVHVERDRKRLNVYALVVPEAHSDFYASLLHSFEEAADRQQRQVLICATTNNIDKQAQIILNLMDKEVAGVAIVPVFGRTTPACHIRELQRRHIPVVLCHRGVDGVQAPLLSIPFQEVGRCAAEAATRLGHQCGAFISTIRSEFSGQFESGLRKAFSDGGGDIPDSYVVFDECLAQGPQGHEHELLAHLERICCRPDRPSVIFTTFDSLAESIYLLLRQLKLRVPEDVSLVGFGDSRRDRIILRRLNSVVIDHSATAKHATTLLEEMGNGMRDIASSESIELLVSMGPGQTLGRAL